MSKELHRPVSIEDQKAMKVWMAGRLLCPENILFGIFTPCQVYIYRSFLKNFD